MTPTARATAPGGSAVPLDGLSADQMAAVNAVTGPVCIVAGAGSGKTRTITHRIAQQVHSGVARADQVLALTFTERAASELKHRLQALGIAGAVRATTFHAAAFAQIRYFWSRLHSTAPPAVLDRKVPLLLPIARQARVEATDLATEIEWAKARLITPDRYAAAARDRDAPLPPEQMAAVYARYEQVKADRDMIDFDDMLTVAHDLMSDADVAGEVRDRYRYFTVAEVQDGNAAPWPLLRCWLGDRDDLCVVGDEDQTIYSFSGATSEYLRTFHDIFPHATVVTLADNYRSTAPVLEVANRLLRADRPDAKQLRAQVAGGPRPQLVACDDDTVERRKTLDWIRNLIDDGVPVHEIAVCVRTNSQTQAWEETFEKAGVPARVHGDRTFFERPEIRQALRALHEAAQAPPSAHPAGPPPLDGTRAAGGRRADRVVEQILRERLSWHPRREPDGHAAKERWRNLLALHELAGRIADEGATDLPAVLAELARRARTAGPDNATPAVTLLTLHKAKGSEFDAVCLVGLEEGLMPITYAATAEELAEERRLLYVGMTRAREHLWLSWAQQRRGWNGKLMKRRRSRFLDDLQPPPTADQRLVGELRAWRLERARRDEVPPYVVFSDRTLRELASMRPTSPTELMAIHGFGTTKVRRYGPELLGLLGTATTRNDHGHQEHGAGRGTR
ncbi:MAG TPA: ATP-dependent DNA helicase UvrD2 [Euzebyales bacterium]|nr:ATP-dependent DNA helicase UvrD2 [Euzebyales bacterium]